MSALIRTINAADQIAALWRSGRLCALAATERLVDLGWYDISVEAGAIVGHYQSVKWRL